MPRYRVAPKRSWWSAIWVTALIVGLVILQAGVIRDSKDVICQQHKAYTIALGKIWRTENKDAQCAK